MSTKIFPMKPLKRSELRRLSEPPQPVEASPEPSWDLQIALAKHEPDPDKEKRAQERAQRRADDRKLANLVAAYAKRIEAVVVGPSAYVRWLVESLRDAPDQQAFIDGTNLMVVMGGVDPCLGCGVIDPNNMGRNSMIIFPSIFACDHPEEVVAGVLCPRCAGNKPQLYARSMLIMVLTQEPTEDNRRRVRKLTLAKRDRELLDWLKRPPDGDNNKVIQKFVDSGGFDAIIRKIDRLLVSEVAIT
jgi:hypothetical protein